MQSAVGGSGWVPKLGLAQALKTLALHLDINKGNELDVKKKMSTGTKYNDLQNHGRPFSILSNSRP